VRARPWTSERARDAVWRCGAASPEYPGLPSPPAYKRSPSTRRASKYSSAIRRAAARCRS
jgi:hypothetical protein